MARASSSEAVGLPRAGSARTKSGNEWAKKVVLADDHEVVRQGLRAVLDLESDLTVVGEASDGLEAVELVRKLKPDVLVLDIVMPRLSGFEAARQIVKMSPETKIIVLSIHSSESYILEALRIGASAYVIKEASTEELISAVREVLAGRRYLSAPFSKKPISAFLRKAKAAEIDPYDTLTAREREILHLAADGLTSVEMAERLCISPRTVETHRARILRKLELHGQTDLVRYALRRGIVPLENSREPGRLKGRNRSEDN